MGHVHTATIEDLRRMNRRDPNARYEVADFRFKGYVNDFMVSPRNPITQKPLPLGGAMVHQTNENQGYQYPQPPKNPPTQSAELRARKEESDKDIALFKQERLQQMIQQEQTKRETEPFREHIVQVPKPPISKPPAAMPPTKPYFKNKQPGNSAVDRALTDTERKIEMLKQEMQELEAKSLKSIPYIDPAHPTTRQVPSQQPFAFYDPWGKGQGNPRRKPNGDQERYISIKEPGIVPTAKEMTQSWPNHNHQTSLDTGTGLQVESKFGGSGEPVKTYSGSNRTRFPTTMRKDIYGNTKMTEMDGYNPFKGKAPGNPEFFPYGKPGGGAPMKDDKGKFNVQRKNVDFAHERDSSAEITQRKRAADEYLHELKKEMAEQRRARNEASVELRAPIGELATIVQQGKVGFPKRDPTTGAILNHHHKTSDVTRAQNGIPESKKFAGVVEGDLNSSMNAKQYHSELSKIAEERHKMRQLEKVRDTQEELRHGETWNDFWGKPGAGAPNSKNPVFKKGNFNSVLHGSQDRNGLVIIKNTPQGIHQLNPDHYSKSTIQSNHVNMFELPNNKTRRERQVDYRPTAPFATAAALPY